MSQTGPARGVLEGPQVTSLKGSTTGAPIPCKDEQTTAMHAQFAIKLTILRNGVLGGNDEFTALMSMSSFTHKVKAIRTGRSPHG